MNHFFPPDPIYSPIFFIGMWLIGTILTGAVTGWYSLMRRFPNRDEAALLTLKSQSGSLRAANMRGILNLSVCPSGLRVGMMRIFGPFCRDFFVPWEEISVVRTERFFQKMAKLSFGKPEIVASLSLPAEVADRLARAAQGRWPESGSFAPEGAAEAASRLFKGWLLSTSIAAGFFTIVPRLVTPNDAPPIAVTVLFPAIVMGIIFLAQYLFRKS